MLDITIVETLESAGWTRDDVEGLALLIGPGSLTATRIGWATAVGWAQSTGVPVTGWSLPQAYRRALGDDAAGTACCVHYRGDTFLAYDLTRPSAAPETIRLDEGARTTIRPHTLTGPGVIGQRDRWMKYFGETVRIVDDHEAVIGGDTLALWGEDDLASGRSLDLRNSPLDYGLPPDFKKTIRP
jgi:hypothetical protein